MIGELILILGGAALVAVVGIRLGILAAPALTRLTDRLAGDDDHEERDGR